MKWWSWIVILIYKLLGCEEEIGADKKTWTVQQRARTAIKIPSKILFGYKSFCLVNNDGYVTS